MSLSNATTPRWNRAQYLRKESGDLHETKRPRYGSSSYKKM